MVFINKMHSISSNSVASIWYHWKYNSIPQSSWSNSLKSLLQNSEIGLRHVIIGKDITARLDKTEQSDQHTILQHRPSISNPINRLIRDRIDHKSKRQVRSMSVETNSNRTYPSFFPLTELQIAIVCGVELNSDRRFKAHIPMLPRYMISLTENWHR